MASGNGNWNSKQDASAEVFEEARGRISGDVRKAAIGALGIGFGDSGFCALVRGTSTPGNQTENLIREELQKT